MPMSKIDKARTIVMMTNAARDTLLSNLNDLPEDWDGFEVRQAVLETCRGLVDPITPIARRRAFEKAFYGGNFTTPKKESDAHLERSNFSEHLLIILRTGNGFECKAYRFEGDD